MQPTHRFADLGTGIRAHYLQWGEGDKPAVLLAHPTGFLADTWTPIAERLAERYTVIAPDTRGHGDSDKPSPEGVAYHWQAFIEDHISFLETLSLRGIPFVGHSAGASVGMYVAARHHEYYTRLVGMEPIIMPGGLTPDEERRNFMAEGARRRRNVFSSAEEMFQQYRSRDTFERWPDDVLRLYCERGTFQREDGQVQLKCPPDVEGEIFANSGSLDIWEVLPDLAAPTLIVRGAETDPFLSMTAESVASRLPNARLDTVPDVGHLLPMEQPNTIADLIIDFLSSG
jgi:pimeloyl-ACP methyl ester carboxylesterase